MPEAAPLFYADGRPVWYLRRESTPLDHRAGLFKRDPLIPLYQYSVERATLDHLRLRMAQHLGAPTLEAECDHNFVTAPHIGDLLKQGCQHVLKHREVHHALGDRRTADTLFGLIAMELSITACYACGYDYQVLAFHRGVRPYAPITSEPS